MRESDPALRDTRYTAPRGEAEERLLGGQSPAMSAVSLQGLA